MIIAVRFGNLSFGKRGRRPNDNERLGNCILIVGQVMAVGNTRL
jgi:hypothetical protein